LRVEDFDYDLPQELIAQEPNFLHQIKSSYQHLLLHTMLLVLQVYYLKSIEKRLLYSQQQLH